MKLKVAGLKIKISWKKLRLANAMKNMFIGQGYTLRPEIMLHPEALRERKIYRLFKQEYCEFFPGSKLNRCQPTSMVYYKGCTEIKCERSLIGELMFGESREDFFKRKGVLIYEDIYEYQIRQEDLILAKFNKEWVEAQGQYQ